MQEKRGIMKSKLILTMTVLLSLSNSVFSQVQEVDVFKNSVDLSLKNKDVKAKKLIGSFFIKGQTVVRQYFF